MQRRTLDYLLIFTLFGAIALAWYWALSPVSTSFHVMGHYSEADIIRKIWHVRLVQLDWVYTTSDFMRWIQYETYARLSLIFGVWLICAGVLIWRYLRTRPVPSVDQISRHPVSSRASASAQS